MSARERRGRAGARGGRDDHHHLTRDHERERPRHARPERLKQISREPQKVRQHVAGHGQCRVGRQRQPDEGRAGCAGRMDAASLEAIAHGIERRLDLSDVLDGEAGAPQLHARRATNLADQLQLIFGKLLDADDDLRD